MLRLSPVICLLALMLAASAAGATPVLRYTWGDASGVVVNQDWSGPHTYTQTLTLTGLTGQVSRVHVSVWTNARQTPPAWRMTVNGPVPANDCLNHPAFFASPDAAGAQTLPGATLSVVGWWMWVTSPRPRIELDVVLDPPLTADPAVRYALATLTFDHANSSIEANPPTGCPGADQPFCFLVWQPYVERPDYSWEALTPEQDVLSWQNPGGATDCYLTVPTRPTTWGRLKAIYR